MNIASLIQRSSQQYRNRIAVVGPTGSRTYGELDERARGLAGGLRTLGLLTGDRVIVLLHNRLEYPEIDVGLAYGGYVRVAMNVRLGLPDFQLAAEDCGARAIISEPRFDDVVAALVENLNLEWIRLDGAPTLLPGNSYEDLVQRGPSLTSVFDGADGNLAWISYTSGTTGRPKGVMLSHHALSHVAFNLILEMGPRNEMGSILLPQPLSHGAGYFVLAYLASGASVHVMSGFDPEEVTHRGRAEKIDTVKLVPTMLSRLLRADLAGPLPYQHIIYGASPMSSTILREAFDAYGPVLSQIYGQTEAPVTITRLSESDHAQSGPHLGSAGRAWRSVEVRIVDSEGEVVSPGELGEVIVRGEHLMSGYFGLPEQTAAVLRSGWIWTKDMGVADEDGYIYLQGRSDEMINSGGFNIAPREVEQVLLGHQEVRECVVMGVPDAEWGQRVCAFVALSNDASINSEQLIEFAAPALGFRQPREIVIVDEFPYSAYGKVDRKALAARRNGHVKLEVSE